VDPALIDANDARELSRAASVVVGSALRLAPGEKVVVFADAASMEIARAIVAAARAASAGAIVADLDAIGARPHKLVPEAWSFALALAKASAFVASAPPEELPMRQHLLHLAAAHRLRHAHMPGISRRAFVHGIRPGLPRVVERGRALVHRLARARTIECESPAGTRLVLRFEAAAGTDEIRWWPQLGVLEPGRWGNLPAGALYANPSSVDGVFVADASLGEWFGRREGLLAHKPVRFHLVDGLVVDVSGGPSLRALEREIAAVLDVAPNSRRVGLCAIGVNDAIAAAVGDPLVDQNRPGLHLSIGDPAARVTGARWSAPTSFAACQSASTIVIDGEPIDLD
jgi:leucyl aminopeptidase (aminopeptidase T)